MWFNDMRPAKRFRCLLRVCIFESKKGPLQMRPDLLRPALAPLCNLLVFKGNRKKLIQ